MLMSSDLLSPRGYHGQMPAEERGDLLDRVGPRLGMAARRRPAPARRARIEARGDVAHGVRTVEGVVRAGIDLDRDWRAGSRGGLDKLPARLGRRPVVLFADEDQPPRDGAIDPRSLAAQPAAHGASRI